MGGQVLDSWWTFTLIWVPLIVVPDRWQLKLVGDGADLGQHLVWPKVAEQ
jgi:hypothetical protein